MLFSVILQLAACDIVGAMRNADDNLEMIFKHDELWVFPFTAQVLMGNYLASKSMTSLYPDLQGNYPDAAFMLNGDTFFILGKFK